VALFALPLTLPCPPPPLPRFSSSISSRPVKAFPEAADEQHDKEALNLAANADRPQTTSKLSPQLMLKRGAQNGDCDMIRDAVDAGADINHRETGEDGACHPVMTENDHFVCESPTVSLYLSLFQTLFQA
jgi:hypothetical protein